MKKGERFNAPGHPLWIGNISEKVIVDRYQGEKMTLGLYPMDFSLKGLHGLGGKIIQSHVWQKSLPNLIGAGVVLRQSTNGRAPF